MDKNLRGIAEQVNIWTLRQDIKILISHLEDMTRNFLASHDHWIHRKENVEAGQLTEHILPPDVLKTILATAAPPLSTAVEPLQWYYENTFIQPLWTDQSLVYKVTLPLISTVTWRRVTVIAWPVPVGNHYVFQTVHVPTQFHCVYGLLRSTPVYDSHCYIVIAKTAALANTALVVARFTASPGELNSPELSTD